MPLQILTFLFHYWQFVDHNTVTEVKLPLKTFNVSNYFTRIYSFMFIVLSCNMHIIQQMIIWVRLAIYVGLTSVIHLMNELILKFMSI